MLRTLSIFLLGFSLTFSARSGVLPDSSHLRVSLLTVGVSDEVYAIFGHTAVRFYDSVKGTDVVFNYGTFNGFEENFELKFMQGKLLYYCSIDDYDQFISTYIRERRRVEEQVLFFTGAQKVQLYEAFANNAKVENRYYKYDFLFDNCATRLRDVFPHTFGEDFKFGQTLPENSKLTYRNITNHYLSTAPWTKFGINLLLGRAMDSVMTNTGAMFLPDYLRDGIGGATVKGQHIATAPVTILKGPHEIVAGPNYPLWTMLGVLLLTTIGLLVPSLKWLGRIMSTALLVVTGLLGVLILVMWFGTDHQACQNNWNVLWCLPTNFLVPFFRKKSRSKYAIIAMAGILATLLLHIIGYQEFAILQLTPLWLALIFVFGIVFKQKGVYRRL